MRACVRACVCVCVCVCVKSVVWKNAIRKYYYYAAVNPGMDRLSKEFYTVKADGVDNTLKRSKIASSYLTPSSETINTVIWCTNWKCFKYTANRVICTPSNGNSVSFEVVYVHQPMVTMSFLTGVFL